MTAQTVLALLDALAASGVRCCDGGGGVQPQPNGSTFRYPPEGFATGTIAGRSVNCLSAEVQVLCHRGYEPTQKDVDDMHALHRAFGVRLPRAYRGRS